MQQVARLFCDSLLPFDFCVQPIRYVGEQCIQAVASIQAIFSNAMFLIHNHSLIPPENEMTVMTHSQIREFRLQFCDAPPQYFEHCCVSPFSIFTHDLFECKERDAGLSSFHVIRRRHPVFSNFTYAHIFFDDVVQLVTTIARAILLIPIALPLAGIGVILRSVRLSFGPCLQKRELEICRTGRCDYATIGKIARAWQQKAVEKYEAVVFEDARIIYKLIGQCMENPKETAWLFHKVRICQDVASHSIQGIMLESSEDLLTIHGENLGLHLKIVHLATNPDNIRSHVNAGIFSRVKGSGTALVAALAHKCLRQHAAGLYLESVPSAVSFYTKLGFVQLDPRKIHMLEAGTIPMQLTAEKIQSLFHNGTFRLPAKGPLVLPPEPAQPWWHNHPVDHTLELSNRELALSLPPREEPSYPCCCC